MPADGLQSFQGPACDLTCHRQGHVSGPSRLGIVGPQNTPGHGLLDEGPIIPLCIHLVEAAFRLWARCCPLLLPSTQHPGQWCCWTRHQSVQRFTSGFLQETSAERLTPDDHLNGYTA